MKKKFLYFFTFWIAAFILMYISFLTILEPLHALRNTTGFVTPLMLPVLLLDFLFEKYFIRRDWIRFGVLAVLNIAGFGLLNYYILKEIVQDREAESNTVLSIIFFFLVFRGIKFLRFGVEQEFKLNNAKELQAKTELMLKEAETSKIQAELDLLKSQINPHFLFNNLNNIYSLIIDKAENASEAVLKLSYLMRYMLESSKNVHVFFN